MIHSFTGGITPEGRLPRTDINVIEVSPSQKQPGVQPAQKPLQLYDRAEIAELASRLSVFDGKTGIYLCDILNSVLDTERILINCCENDLYSACTAAFCTGQLESLVGGCAILLYAFNAQKAVFCCDRRSKTLASALDVSTHKRGDMAVAVIEDKYPITPQTLVAAIYGKGRVQHTFDTQKYTVIGAEAAIALYNGMAYGATHDSKVFSICEEGKRPIAVKAPLGMPLADVFKEVGIEYGLESRAFCGSLINCIPVDTDTAVVETTTEQISLINTEVEYAPTKCINCGKCTVVCPMQTDVMSFVSAGGKKPFKYTDICAKCGCCGFICPSRIDILRLASDTEDTKTEERYDEQFDAAT